ncbi:MAG: hypothetical protein Q4D91_03495 [Lautropia sp.]|nr:hypothetical protein [Lautropia sp.]
MMCSQDDKSDESGRAAKSFENHEADDATENATATATAAAIMVRLDAFRGRLPDGFRFDRDEVSDRIDDAGPMKLDPDLPVVADQIRRDQG